MIVITTALVEQALSGGSISTLVTLTAAAKKGKSVVVLWRSRTFGMLAKIYYGMHGATRSIECMIY